MSQREQFAAIPDGLYMFVPYLCIICHVLHMKKIPCTIFWLAEKLQSGKSCARLRIHELVYGCGTSQGAPQSFTFHVQRGQLKPPYRPGWNSFEARESQERHYGQGRCWEAFFFFGLARSQPILKGRTIKEALGYSGHADFFSRHTMVFLGVPRTSARGGSFKRNF